MNALGFVERVSNCQVRHPCGSREGNREASGAGAERPERARAIDCAQGFEARQYFPQSSLRRSPA